MSDTPRPSDGLLPESDFVDGVLAHDVLRRSKHHCWPNQSLAEAHEAGYERGYYACHEESQKRIADLERDNDALKIMLMDDAHAFKVLESKLGVAIEALESIYIEAKKGDGTTTECEMAGLAEEVLEKLK